MPTYERTNSDRAMSTLTGVNAYVADTRHGPDKRTWTREELAADATLARELIGDLICDLLHLADTVGLGADLAYDAGRGHYEAEKNG